MNRRIIAIITILLVTLQPKTQAISEHSWNNWTYIGAAVGAAIGSGIAYNKSKKRHSEKPKWVKTPAQHVKYWIQEYGHYVGCLALCALGGAVLTRTFLYSWIPRQQYGTALVKRDTLSEMCVLKAKTAHDAQTFYLLEDYPYVAAADATKKAHDTAMSAEHNCTRAMVDAAADGNTALVALAKNLKTEVQGFGEKATDLLGEIREADGYRHQQGLLLATQNLAVAKEQLDLARAEHWRKLWRPQQVTVVVQDPMRYYP